MSDLDTYLEQFFPMRDDDGWVSEDQVIYASRMQSTVLPQWPSEVLIEWFHRHDQCLVKYAFLKYERFQFCRQTWQLDHIPDRQAFDDELFCDDFMDIEYRAEQRQDWLAQYMFRHGTWNTPVILLDNHDYKYGRAYNRILKSPYHLLEGHRRLSFLNGLRKLGRALPQHDVWIVKIMDSNT